MRDDNKCKDCLNLSARDVFNGVCISSKKKILIDDAACPDFAMTNKCKFCANYKMSAKEANLGTCDGIMVFPDLAACEKFARI